MDASEQIAAAARAVAALAPALDTLQADAEVPADVRRAVARGWFTPDEDERIRAWFARYLTARGELLETVNDLKPVADGQAAGADPDTQLRAFVVAYAAAAVLVRAARFLLSTLATHKLVQRKLNEAEPRYRIARKQFTAIYRSLTDPANAWQLHHAIEFAAEHRPAIDALAGDPQLAPVVEHLRAAEEALQIGARQYVKARFRFRWHSLRRRRALAAHHALHALAEVCGRIFAELRTPRSGPRIDAETVAALQALLEPGDVIITRHHAALTNLFLPGYWPHASLHVGTAATARSLGVTVDEYRAERWTGSRRVLEARKDGVLFRTLPDTLSVDATAVIRPRLPAAQVAEAVSRAVTHEGKLYNFDFDFFRSDRLVCTEVVYRAYDGVGPMRFGLSVRAGRPTLSAEDLLDMAMDDRGFEPLAVFGTDLCRDRLVVGPEARQIIVASYRNPP